MVAKTEELVEAEVLRDYWPTERDEDRVRKGTIIKVTKDQLIDGLTRGIMKKAD